MARVSPYVLLLRAFGGYAFREPNVIPLLVLQMQAVRDTRTSTPTPGIDGPHRRRVRGPFMALLA
jgi:hypothetical protein